MALRLVCLILRMLGVSEKELENVLKLKSLVTKSKTGFSKLGFMWIPTQPLIVNFWCTNSQGDDRWANVKCEKLFDMYYDCQK